MCAKLSGHPVHVYSYFLLIL